MHEITLTLHTYLRWGILLLLILTAARAIVGALGGKPYSPTDQRFGLLTMIALDLQLLLGLALYFLLSPTTKMALSNFGAAMASRTTRFWAVEHVSLALLAVFLVHFGRVLARKATSDRKRHRRIAVTFFLALACTLAAIPWPFIAGIGRPWLR